MVAEAPRILLADDEDTFRRATCELLQQEGYRCDAAPDAAAASRMLSDEHDVLISDIRMPGNLQLEFLRDVHARFPLLPIVVVTGYPSVETAIATIRLSFVDYLLKPIEWPELLHALAQAAGKRRMGQDARAAFEEAARLTAALGRLQRAALGTGQEETVQGLGWTVDRYLAQSTDRIDALATQTGQVLAAVRAGGAAQPDDVCQFMDCPRLTAYRGALVETIAVLERTRHAFKSKDLGELRHRLEALLNEADR